MITSSRVCTTPAAYNVLFSTYILGLTDGSTVWSLAINATGALAIQWPYYIPFEAAYDNNALLLGAFSGSDSSPQFQVGSLWVLQVVLVVKTLFHRVCVSNHVC